MSNSKLLKLLSLESNELFNAFEKASLEGCGTPQEVSDFREYHFNKLIAKFFPFPYRITKGIINDINNLQSASIDTLIIAPNHPHIISSSGDGKYSVILADGLDAAIELKPDISKTAELERGLKQIITVKKLRRYKSSIILQNKVSQEEIEFSKTIPSFIFSIKACKNPIDTAKRIMDFYIKNNTLTSEQVDYVVINNKGIICNFKLLNISPINKLGMYYVKLDENTLAMFIFLLSSVYPAEPRVSPNILSVYIEKLIPISSYQKIEV